MHIRVRGRLARWPGACRNRLCCCSSSRIIAAAAAAGKSHDSHSLIGSGCLKQKTFRRLARRDGAAPRKFQPSEWRGHRASSAPCSRSSAHPERVLLERNLKFFTLAVKSEHEFTSMFQSQSWTLLICSANHMLKWLGCQTFAGLLREESQWEFTDLDAAILSDVCAVVV